MLLLIAGLGLVALTVFAVWRVSSRAWHYIAIAVLALALMPLFASTVTGDVSRYLPGAMFADDASGKDQVILASVVATAALAVLAAAGVFALAQTLWRRVRPDGA